MNPKPLHQSRTLWAALVTSGATLLGARLGLTAEETAWVATLGLAVIAELRRRDGLKARASARPVAEPHVEVTRVDGP
jgi:hypothetical protein